MILTFRKPTIQDTATLFAWQQHPETRESNPRHMYPKWESYVEYVAKLADDPDEMLVLLCANGHPVGFIVFFDKSPDVGFGMRTAPGLHKRGFEATMVEYAKQRFGSRLVTKSFSKQEDDELTNMGFSLEDELTGIWRYRG
jgi:hypothetical protein